MFLLANILCSRVYCYVALANEKKKKVFIPYLCFYWLIIEVYLVSGQTSRPLLANQGAYSIVRAFRLYISKVILVEGDDLDEISSLLYLPFLFFRS